MISQLVQRRKPTLKWIMDYANVSPINSETYGRIEHILVLVVVSDYTVYVSVRSVTKITNKFSFSTDDDTAFFEYYSNESSKNQNLEGMLNYNLFVRKISVRCN